MKSCHNASATDSCFHSELSALPLGGGGHKWGPVVCCPRGHISLTIFSYSFWTYFFLPLLGTANNSDEKAAPTKTPPNSPSETPSESRASPETVTQPSEAQETEGGLPENEDGTSCPSLDTDKLESTTQESSQSKEPSQVAGTEGASDDAVALDPPTAESVE